MNKKVVLAVDDHDMQLDIYKKFLESNYEVRLVKAASHALNFLNNNKVDLILLDIVMPNISGFEFLYDIRKIPTYIDVPIIVVSSESSPDFLAEAKASSAFDVLIKPITKNILIAAIEKAFEAAAVKRK